MPTDTEHDELAPAERETLPPTAASEPPAGFDPLPSESLRKLEGFNPDLFLHAALLAAADSAHEQRQANKGVAQLEKLLDRQTDRILKETSADYDSLRSSITGVQKSVDALVTRVGNTETALDEGHRRFAALDDEIAALRSQFARLEQLPAYLDRLQKQIDELKNEGNHVTAEAAAATGEQPTTTDPK